MKWLERWYQTNTVPYLRIEPHHKLDHMSWHDDDHSKVGHIDHDDDGVVDHVDGQEAFVQAIED